MTIQTLTPEVALVTGAAQGIGRAIALRLAKDGFDVAINDLLAAEDALNGVRKEITALGRRAFVFIGDVSVEKDVQNMVSSVVENLGQLNVMVANAGVCRSTPILETEVSQWDFLLSVNVVGLFLCYKYAAMQMIKQGKGGRILGASSVAGRRGEMYMGTYSATKFAVRGLAQVAGE
ncbi:hypothetical protein H0H81_010906 [Sphagnurus paluster]|uniref:NAD(P)-binding protein n=1 Tax=Sphagnurus paluster TaxID=117069 RepID=A0A9P7FNX5_9AGAR|nr:hypothetical protein H0H81_010906 [Sphagnurus paluster]